MRRSLFRSEVTAAKSSDWFGQVILLQPLSLRLITWVIILSTLGTLAFLFHAQYTKRVSVSGVLMPDLGLIKVQSPHNGIVLERRVSEGQQVNAGDVLYVITSESMYLPEGIGRQSAGVTSTVLTQLNQREKIIQSDNERSKIEAERELAQERTRIASLQVEVQQLDQEILIQLERLDSKSKQYLSNEAAQKNGFISVLALQQKHDELLDQKARLASMKRSRIGLAREMTSAQANLDSTKNKHLLAHSQFKKQILEVEQDRVTREANNRILVTAPQAGTIAAVLVQPGQRVDTQTMLTIVPKNSQLEAQLYISNNFVGYIREGDLVEIHVTAFPYQTFGGIKAKVSAISSTTLAPAELINDASGANVGGKNESSYRVKVKLPTQFLTATGRQNQLRSGMQVEAKITQDRRSLVEWILAPLFRLKEKT